MYRIWLTVAGLQGAAPANLVSKFDEFSGHFTFDSPGSSGHFTSLFLTPKPDTGESTALLVSPRSTAHQTRTLTRTQRDTTRASSTRSHAASRVSTISHTLVLTTLPSASYHRLSHVSGGRRAGGAHRFQRPHGLPHHRREWGPHEDHGLPREWLGGHVRRTTADIITGIAAVLALTAAMRGPQRPH